MKPNKIKYGISDLGVGLEIKTKYIDGEIGNYVLNWRYKGDKNWRNFPMPESLVFQLEWHTLEENLSFAKTLGENINGYK